MIQHYSYTPVLKLIAATARGVFLNHYEACLKIERENSKIGFYLLSIPAFCR